MSSGFLYAYVVFLTEEICLLLLSSKESPEQFHLFQNQKNIITNHLETLNAYAKIDFALYSFSQWRPHRDIDYLKHFIYKNELTCQCICPEEEKEEKEDEEKVYKQQVNMDRMQQYTRLHTQMISMSTTSNISTSQVLTKPLYMMNGSSILSKLMYLEEEANGLYMGIATEHDRLYAFFQVPSGLLTPVEAQQSCEVLLQLLRKDEQLVIPSTTLSTNAMGTSSFSSSFTSYSSWP
jgi:hypothetical protein